MIYPKDFENKIGFDSIRSALLNLCSGRLGKEEVENMKFTDSFDEISHRLKCVEEMIEINKSNQPFPTLIHHDVLSYLYKIKIQNSFISPERLYHLMQMFQTFEDLKTFFESQKKNDDGIVLFGELEKESSGLQIFSDLRKKIALTINKFGEVKDTASPALYDIRQQIKKANGSVQHAIKRVYDRAVNAGIADKDQSPSIRDGRLVIPVPAEKKRLITGIIHDESASGKTVFIEPIEVVEAGNKLRELEIEEKREETAILISLADEIRPYIDEIASCCRILGKFDFIMAKASLAQDLNANLPHLNPHPELEWYHAIHPSLELSLRNSGREVVPLDVTLSKKQRILVISGPNAGGKSVCLKTVAVVQYMMQCGLLPTLYENSHMGIFENIFIDIGDEQSFENDLSTYSSHLKNMRFFINKANKRSLILADEIGSGTEPQIGGAMAQAILSELGESGCYGVVTTHYQNLKTFAESAPGFVNGAMLYDRAKLEPTFQLSIGNPGSSFAIDIAYKMGLPKNVIEHAKEIVGEDYVNIDKYLSDLARDRKYWANKRLNIKEKEHKLENILENYEEITGDLKAKRKAIIAEARKEAKEILDGANARIERTILEIRKAQAEKEKTKELRKELKNFAENNIKETKNDEVLNGIKKIKHKSKKSQQEKKLQSSDNNLKKTISVGDYVKLNDGNTVGKVLEISGKNAEVLFGVLRTKVKLDRLVPSSKPKEKALEAISSISDQTYNEVRNRQLNFKNEIDVRGMRADEALQAVTYFIDDAIQFGISKVRILHGTGHGILKTLIRQQLKSNSAISSFGDEDIRMGGSGITVVELM